MKTFVAAGAAVLLLGVAAPTLQGQGAPALKISSAAPSVPAWNPNLPKPAPPPRNADGHPDLTGVWDYKIGTPLQRAPEYAKTLFLNAKDAADYGKRIADARDTNKRSENVEMDAYGRGMNNEWFDNDGLLAQGRTSFIVDPPDGRLPALTPAAKEQMVPSHFTASRSPHGLARRDLALDDRRADSARDRSYSERCLVQNGPPWWPQPWNSNLQILHTKNAVVIHTEMIHTARIVWLDGRPKPDLKQWAGVSRGRWEGDTLIIETTNFRPDATWLGLLHPENFTLIERLTRIDADTVLYEYTINDPETYTRPWTSQMPMKQLKGFMYEYACHEGNYGLKYQMMASRAEEKAAAKGKSEGTK